MGREVSWRRINRYIMECKYCLCKRFTWCPWELIDTLWNVNVKIIRWQSGQLEELIDTLWNVNLTIVPSFGDSAGINRYIMECK